MNKRLKIAWYLIVGLFIMNPTAVTEVQGQTAVIVNRVNPVTNISKAQLLDIYIGDEIVWKNTSRIYPVAIRTSQSISKNFFKMGLGKNIGRVKRIWIKLSLSGKTSPPKILNSTSEVVAYVSQNEGAIGFIPLEELDERVKAVKIDGKALNERDYFLRQKTD